MPKNWNRHKTEIERLYMIEGRPLKDVRDILRTRYRFDASTRAYRMKLDEWRLWKNNSKNDRRRIKRISRQQRAIRVSEPPESTPPALPPLPSLPADIPGPLDEFLRDYDIVLPNEMEISELLDRIHFLPYPDRGLEIMLYKWRSDGTYLKAAPIYLQEECHGYLPYFCFLTLEGKSLFHLIREKVASDEQFPLTKACLKANLKRTLELDLTYLEIGWMREWRNACRSNTWEEAKASLYRAASLHDNHQSGTIFLDCTLVVIAEKLLADNMELFNKWTAHIEDFDFSKEPDAQVCRREYMDILSHFSIANFDIDLFWYKHAVKMNKRNDKMVARNQLRQTDESQQLEEYRSKYRRLEDLCGSVDGGIDGMVQNLLLTAKFLNSSKGILEPVRSDDASLDNGPATTTTLSQITNAPERRDSTQNVLEKIYTEWELGKRIDDDVAGLLDDFVSRLRANQHADENIFNQIAKTVPQYNQLLFTKDVLHAAGWIRISPRELESNENLWHQINNSSNWEELRQHLDSNVLAVYVIDKISEEAAKFVFDATVVLVGERRLSRLKAEIQRGHLLAADDFDYQVYHMYRRDYMAVLNTIHSRDLKIDQHWFAFLGLMLQWEITGYEVEMSEDEPGEPGDDSGTTPTGLDESGDESDQPGEESRTESMSALSPDSEIG